MVQRGKNISGRGSLRIIAGSWRGRKLNIADAPGLRPTPDRVRETVFNWLAADIADARCLDLFAGTGALGIEALSRGAAYCCFVDQNLRAAKSLKNSLQQLDAADRSEVLQSTALDYLASLTDGHAKVGLPFDLVFLDPPFTDDLLAPTLETLADSPHLSEAAQIYIEQAAGSPNFVPDGWHMHRAKQSGDVSYGLLERD